MSILADLGYPTSPGVITAFSVPVFQGRPEGKIDANSLFNLKRRLVVKNAIEAGLVDADTLKKVFDQVKVEDSKQ